MEKSKRLYRSRKDKVISGLCGGIAEYFDIDPVLVRILWVILGIGISGSGIFVYIIAAIVVPKEPMGVKTNPSTQAQEFTQDEDMVFDTPNEYAEAPMEKERGIFGIIIGLLLILIGSSILAMNILNISFSYILSLNYDLIIAFSRYFWPTCLILLGLFFLIKSK